MENFYVESGRGEPLLLLHGNGESHEYFIHQIEYFSKKYRVIALDTRGHGQTARGKAPFTIRQFAEDLYHFMQQRGIKKAHILGFSDGGNIALVFAMKYPQCVNKLILNGANLYSKGVKPSIQIPIIIGYKFAVMFAPKSKEAQKNAEMLGLMVNEPNIHPDELAQISAHTLVIAGTRDMIKKSHTELISRRIPNAKLILIKGNHFIANKQPEVFNSAVESFLSENK